MATSKSARPTPSTPPEFLKAASEPHNWLILADRLFNAAETIWKKSERQRRGGRRMPNGLVVKTVRAPVSFATAAMLYGYGVENVLKALRVKQIAATGDAVIVTGKTGEELAPSLTRHHNLVQLARHAGLSLTRDEESVLERLSQFVSWGGRYPMPLRPPASTGVWNDAWQKLSFGDGEIMVLWRFVERVQAEIRS